MNKIIIFDESDNEQANKIISDFLKDIFDKEDFDTEEEKVFAHVLKNFSNDLDFTTDVWVKVQYPDHIKEVTSFIKSNSSATKDDVKMLVEKLFNLEEA